jgi:hypothetical protein
MDGSRVTELINKAKSNGQPESFNSHCHQSDALSVDVEVKVDALTKLQAELEAGAEVRPQAFVPARC